MTVKRTSPCKPIGTTTTRGTIDLGAGLDASRTSPGSHPAGPPQHGPLGQTERAFSAASTFLSGILAISASQLLGAPLKLIDPQFYDGYMAWTKESFAVLCTTMTQWWAPTAIRVTGDDSMKGQLFQMDDGSLRCNFPHRVVMMANHQLYTDWLYLWWIAYTNKMHGRIYIILKESLKQIPIFGWGAQFYNFIFLSRKWQTDRPRFRRALGHLGQVADPMWLLIFPEGTNLSKPTREASKAWADKQGIPDMKNLLLPRSTGLQFCLQELAKTTNWLYDCTIAYEGVPPGQFGQDIFTLRSSFFEGRPPKSVNMHWRRFRISSIPTNDADAFGMWLRNRWTEKDHLLEYFYRYGAFPVGDPIAAMREGNRLERFPKSRSSHGDKVLMNAKPETAKFITTEVKAGGWEEFSGIFTPLASAMNAVSDGNISPDNVDFEALLSKMVKQQKPENSIPSPLKTPESHSLGPNNVATTGGKFPGVVSGKNLDPEIYNLIKRTHDAAQQRMNQASKPVSARKPDIAGQFPHTPVETIVTRPLSTMAVQRASQALKRTAPPKLLRKNDTTMPSDTVDKTSARTTASKSIKLPPRAVAQKPIKARTDSDTGKAIGKSRHPLAGRTVTPEQLKKLGFVPLSQGSKK